MALQKGESPPHIQVRAWINILTDPHHKGSHQKQKTEKVGLLDQPADPPPLPVTWSKKNGKKFQCLFCILDHSEQFIFS